MKRILDDEKKCTGCLACVSVCSLKAIHIVEDARGFLAPVIDETRCKDCGMCSAACPVKQEGELVPYLSDNCLVAQNKDELIVRQSQSGGMFSAIAQTVLEQGGIVYGAALEGNIHVRHIRIDRMEDIVVLRGSKYIQSDVSGVYVSVLKDLHSGYHVLFSGTPCQCDGLRQFMKAKQADTRKLYLVDLICHGVPSPRIWRDYVAFLEAKYKKPVRYINFRDKAYGWVSHIETIGFEDVKVSLEVFKRIFCTSICLRSSCYTCRYSNLKRVGDITIGDAWSTDRSKQYRSDSGGMSIVLINTDKGRELFQRFCDKIAFECKPLADFMQPNLHQPTSCIENVDMFWKDYDRFGFKFARFVFGSSGFFSRAVRKVRRMLIEYFGSVM